MTDPLHISARPGAPIACDMSTAVDTPDERLAEYGRLYERALVRRERGDGGVAFTFRAEDGVRELADTLARREAACCPFVDYHVETVGDEVIWTITNPVTGEDRASVDVMLDAFYVLPDHAGTDMDALLGRLAERGVRVDEPEPQRYVLRTSGKLSRNGAIQRRAPAARRGA
jgi:hypothetical protein